MERFETLKFQNSIVATPGNYYIRLSASTVGELFFYGMPQLDESIIDVASNSEIITVGEVTQGSFNPYNTKSWSIFFNKAGSVTYDSNNFFILYLLCFDFDLDFFIF